MKDDQSGIGKFGKAGMMPIFAMALVGGVTSFLVKGPIAAAIFGGLILLFVGAFVAGIRIAARKEPSPELKRALRTQLDAQGFTKATRAERRRTGRFGFIALIWMFLSVPAVFALNAYLIKGRFSTLLPDALLVLAIGAVSFWLGTAISKALGAAIRPLDKWID
jgi:hypothetical protein